MRLQKASSRCPQYLLIKATILVLVMRLRDVFKTFFKATSRRFQSALLRRLQDVLQKRLEDVFNTISRCLEDVLKTFWRHFENMSFLKTKRFQDVFKMYHQIRMFLLGRLQDVLSTFSIRTAKTIIYRKIRLGHAPQKFIVRVQVFQQWTLWIYWNS